MLFPTLACGKGMPFQFRWRGSWMGRGGQHNGQPGEGASATAGPGMGGRAAGQGKGQAARSARGRGGRSCRQWEGWASGRAGEGRARQLAVAGVVRARGRSEELWRGGLAGSATSQGRGRYSVLPGERRARWLVVVWLGCRRVVASMVVSVQRTKTGELFCWSDPSLLTA